MNRKILITTVLGASCLGAGAMTFNAFAAGPSSPAVVIQQDDTVAADPAEGDAAPDKGARLAEVLAPLVTDGTINQSQADAVIAALQEAGPLGGGHGPRRGMPGLDAAAEALGMTKLELAAELQGGATVADVAAAQGVDVQVVIDALVEEATTHIDAKVADGTLTQEEADERLAELTERITDRVNNGRPEGGRGGPRGPRGGDAPAADEVPATTEG